MNWVEKWSQHEGFVGHIFKALDYEQEDRVREWVLEELTRTSLTQNKLIYPRIIRDIQENKEKLRDLLYDYNLLHFLDQAIERLLNQALLSDHLGIVKRLLRYEHEKLSDEKNFIPELTKGSRVFKYTQNIINKTVDRIDVLKEVLSELMIRQRYLIAIQEELLNCRMYDKNIMEIIKDYT